MALFGKKRRERTIFFPWERRGFARALSLPRRRATVWMGVVLGVALFVWIVARSRQERNARVTRQAIEHTRLAVDAYRADHSGQCPRDLLQLTAPEDHEAYLASVPMDAWGRPLRFACPSRDANRAYDLLSDGPDGEPYGLDRIE
jgi:hypothetical protein